MSYRVPKTAKNFNVFVQGEGMAGVATEIELPEVKVKGVSHRAAGMDFPIILDQGLEQLQFKFTLAEFSAAVKGLVGARNGHNTMITFKGSIGDDSAAGATVPVIANIKGLISEGAPSAWKTGEITGDKFAVDCKFYELLVNGKEVYHIDVDNFVRRIDGVDQTASQKADIGF
jgi:P2 family phage contractile tail tube protein